MFGLTQLGVIHTAISLVAVVAGAIALIRYRQITLDGTIGRVYFVTTALTALTGFGIFQHGGFGKPHAVGVLTLIVLAIALLARRTSIFGRNSRAVEVVSYSATFFFHMIPGVVETTTRLPLGAPLLPNADAPELQVASAILFALFLIGATLQVRRLRSQPHIALEAART